MGAGHVQAEKESAFGVRYYLEETGQLSHGVSLAKLAHLHSAGDDLLAGFLCLGFTHSDFPDLWGGEDGGGNDAVVHGPFLPKDIVQGAESLHGGHMGQHDVAGAEDVAYGVDAGDVCHEVLVHGNPSAFVGGDAGLFKAEAVSRGFAADGDEHHVGLDGFLSAFFSGNVHKGGRRGHGMNDAVGNLQIPEGFTGHDLNLELAQLAVEQCAHVLVHGGHGQNPVLPFDDGHSAAEGPVDAGKFAADDAAADNAQAGGNSVEAERVVAVKDVLVIEGQAGQFKHAGTGSDDHGIAGYGLISVLCVHEDFLRTQNFGLAAHEADFESGAALFESGAQDADDTVLAFADGVQADFRGSGFHPVFGKTAGQHDGVSAGAQGFGGDASAVEAGASDFGHIYECDFNAFLCGGESCRIAAGAGADDGEFHVCRLLVVRAFELEIVGDRESGLQGSGDEAALAHDFGDMVKDGFVRGVHDHGDVEGNAEDAAAALVISAGGYSGASFDSVVFRASDIKGLVQGCGVAVQH